MAHRGVYGTGGGGGMYKSRIAGFSFLVDPFTELQGDWALVREQLFFKKKERKNVAQLLVSEFFPTTGPDPQYTHLIDFTLLVPAGNKLHCCC